MVLETLQSNLARLMADRELSANALAERAGVAQNTVSYILRPDRRGGRVTPTLASVVAIADALGVEPWQLLKPRNPS